MASRISLQALLVSILGSPNVYYQHPDTMEMDYPAIVYERKDIANDFADDNVYAQYHSYSVTVIDPNPDSLIVEAISKLPKCNYDRGFKADNLNHDVFILYY